MSNKPFSLRLTEQVHRFLEAVQHQSQKKLQRTVPLSEVVQSLLDRPPVTGNLTLEVAALSAEPTKTLENIRILVAMNLPILNSNALFLAQLVHEYSQSQSTSEYKNSDWLPLIDALAELISALPESKHESYYLSNLGIYHEPQARDLKELPFKEAVRNLLDKFREKISTSEHQLSFEMAARCLEVALRDEPLSESQINAALQPHWPGLFRLATRWHVQTAGCPLKIVYEGMSTSEETRHHFNDGKPRGTMATAAEDGITINLAYTDDCDLAGYIGLGEHSAFTIGRYGDLLQLLQGLAKPRIFNNSLKYNIYPLSNDRMGIMIGSSIHYIPNDQADSLEQKLYNIIEDPAHAEFFAALNSAYGV